MACRPLLSEDDLCRFRTKSCRRLSNGGCGFGLARCQYSHSKHWNRRCPVYVSNHSFLRYVHLLCPNVQLVKETTGGSDVSLRCLSTCERGWECPFAHSREEALYHPLVYKTVLCQRFQRGSCSVYYCPYIHAQAEARQPKCYRLPFTSGIDIPSISNVIVVPHIAKNPKVPFQQGGRCESQSDNTALAKDAANSSNKAKNKNSKKAASASPASSTASLSICPDKTTRSATQETKRDKKRSQPPNNKIKRAEEETRPCSRGREDTQDRSGSAAAASEASAAQQRQQRQQKRTHGTRETETTSPLEASFALRASASTCDGDSSHGENEPAEDAAAGGRGTDGGNRQEQQQDRDRDTLFPRSLVRFLKSHWALPTSGDECPTGCVALKGQVSSFWDGHIEKEAPDVLPGLLLLSAEGKQLEGLDISCEGTVSSPSGFFRDTLLSFCADASALAAQELQDPDNGDSSSYAKPSPSSNASHPGCIVDVLGGDGPGCEDDNSTAFSCSPAGAATNSLCSPPDSPALTLVIEGDSSLFSCCTGEAERGTFPALSTPASCSSPWEAEEWRYTTLEQAVNILCDDWGDCDNGGALLGHEEALRFCGFGVLPEERKRAFQQQDRGDRPTLAIAERGVSPPLCGPHA